MISRRITSSEGNVVNGEAHITTTGTCQVPLRFSATFVFSVTGIGPCGFRSPTALPFSALASMSAWLSGRKGKSFLASMRLDLLPQKNSRKRPGAPLEDEEAGAVLAVGIGLGGLGGDPLELFRFHVVGNDQGFHVGHVDGLGPAGQREQVHGRPQVDDLLVGLGDAVVARGDQALHVGFALGKELHPADVVAALRQFGELIVGADLGGRKLVEIDGDHRSVVGHCGFLVGVQDSGLKKVRYSLSFRLSIARLGLVTWPYPPFQYSRAGSR